MFYYLCCYLRCDLRYKSHNRFYTNNVMMTVDIVIVTVLAIAADCMILLSSQFKPLSFLSLSLLL